MENVFNIPLFFGFFLDENLQTKIKEINPYQENLFLNDQTGNYLQGLVYDNQNLIGKWIGSITTLQQLKLLENHIYSILAKVIPTFDAKNYPLMIIPVPQIHESYAKGQ